MKGKLKIYEQTRTIFLSMFFNGYEGRSSQALSSSRVGSYSVVTAIIKKNNYVIHDILKLIK
jgi:hypothetical protein